MVEPSRFQTLAARLLPGLDHRRRHSPATATSACCWPRPSGRGLDTAADLVVMASGWFIEYLLFDVGAITTMTENGVSDASLDGMIVEPRARRHGKLSHQDDQRPPRPRRLEPAVEPLRLVLEREVGISGDGEGGRKRVLARPLRALRRRRREEASRAS